MVKDRFFSLIELYYLLLFRRNTGDIPSYLFVFFLVVHIDVRERVVKQVSQNCSGLAVLCKQRLYALVLREIFPGIFPFTDKRLQLCNQNSCVLAFSRGADDCTVILGKNTPDKCLKSLLLLLGGDFLGYAYLLGEGKQYYVSSCQ